ncbi:stage III sporulation protein AG [Halobacillus halophilus]|uniref:Stage III sporulation protein AG n=1 Tax=Halobacillus halophilus (strain ATCC 35676 / DSM 2266 / JCM 20832 / KCTC 3685 / LMG 17431 / NBRC 102448 / NCIMB 2269) TaxID=866895 RepID=I0JNV7_HALH3|nr:stage III sporulation protein AG [Halobacillus halophilus]ASF39872.1 stage III sporulation protein AG [Halobacillus halophilus]CCG45827.1 stage III sporulation protein AG [Halobacillus halophilus DSM 2266]
MNKWWSKLLEPLSSKEGKKINKPKYFIGLGLIGVLIILSSNWFQSNEPAPPSQGETAEKSAVSSEASDAPELTDSINQLEKGYEKQLKPLLENIEGVSSVDIMINLSATHEKVYDKNLIIGKQTTKETDKNGGEREIEDYSKEQQLVLVRQGDREVPLLTKTTKPEVSGVFVTAKGVDQIQVKGWVVEAVSRVLDVPSHRISVLPKQ